MRALVCLVVALLAGCADAPAPDPASDDAAPGDPRGTPIALDASTRRAAVDHVATRPNVTYVRGEVSWDQHFEDTYLGSQVGAPEAAWFEGDAPNVTAWRDEAGTATVSFLGLPGCREDASVPWTSDDGPNWFKADGTRCWLVWRIDVVLDPASRPLRVGYAELGGVA